MKHANYLIKHLKCEFTTAYSGAVAKMNYILQIGHLRIRLISIEKVFPNPNWHCPKHSHVYYEFHVIADGKGTIVIDCETFNVQKGTLLITGPGVKHTQTSDPANPIFEYCIKCNLQVVDEMFASDLLQKQEALSVVQTLASTYKYPFLDIYNIKSMIDLLYKEVETKSSGYILAFQNKLIEIILSFYRTVRCSAAHLDQGALKIYKSHEEHVKQIVDFIQNNYSKEITVHDLEQQVILSEKQINRIMKKEFGQTFHSYLQNMRVQKVVELSKSTKLTVEQIAAQCGFSSARNLYQALKKHNCQTPSQIRSGNFAP